MPDLLDIEVKIDGAEHLFNQLGVLLGKDAREVIRMRAPTMARYLASATMTVDVAGIEEGGYANGTAGTSPVARAMGIGAVRREMHQMFTEVRKVEPHKQRGDLCVVTSRNGKTFLAERSKCITDAATLKTVHRRDRRYSGNRPASEGWLVPKTILEPYRKFEEKRVGWGKSGWNSAADQFGNVRVPSWMKQPGAPGSASDHTSNPMHPAIFLNNEVPYLDAILRPTYFVNALEAFARSLEKEVAIVMAKTIAEQEGVANRRRSN